MVSSLSLKLPPLFLLAYLPFVCLGALNIFNCSVTLLLLFLPPLTRLPEEFVSSDLRRTDANLRRTDANLRRTMIFNWAMMLK